MTRRGCVTLGPHDPTVVSGTIVDRTNNHDLNSCSTTAPRPTPPVNRSLASPEGACRLVTFVGSEHDTTVWSRRRRRRGCPHGRRVGARGRGLRGRVRRRTASARSRRIESSPPSLVVLDLSLPGVGGLDILRRVRQRGAAQWPVPAARSSCCRDATARPTASSASTSAPTTTSSSRSHPGELAARARSVLRRCGEATAAVHSIVRPTGCRRGDRRDARDVWVDGEPVDLAAKEFELLAYFVDHPRRACTRDELLAAVWSSDSGWQTESTVTEHVYRLRSEGRGRPATTEALRRYAPSGIDGRGERMGMLRRRGDRRARPTDAVMEQLASGARAVGGARLIVVALEELMPASRCSVLLLDEVTAPPARCGTHAADGVLGAIDGLEPGPLAGSCGTAVHLGEPGRSPPTSRTDPRWEAFRDVAVEHDCARAGRARSGPVDEVVGTFAVYDRTMPYEPDERERELVRRFTHLASIAVEHDGRPGSARRATSPTWPASRPSGRTMRSRSSSRRSATSCARRCRRSPASPRT
jgi:two-component system, OmpR family, phosphate regulon response regulator PhoB